MAIVMEWRHASGALVRIADDAYRNEGAEELERRRKETARQVARIDRMVRAARADGQAVKSE